jgi:hypothetical protein
MTVRKPVKNPTLKKKKFKRGLRKIKCDYKFGKLARKTPSSFEEGAGGWFYFAEIVLLNYCVL